MKILHYEDMEASPVTHEEVKGVTIRWLISREDNAPNFAMRLFEVESEGNTPLHSHAWEHEVFVLDGEGAVWKEGKEVAVGPGMAIYVPPDEKHCFKNVGKGIFRFICLVPMSAV